ncbi:MAG: 30S ribosomal protein S15 [Candidatus Carsonella ruddii]
MKNKLLLNKNSGEIKIQNYFIIKKIKKIKVHFFKNKKDKKCKIIINILLNKIKKNIIYIKKKI